MEVSEKGGIEQIPILIKNETGVTTGETVAGTAGEPRRSADKVVLSPRAREIHDAKMKLMDIPDIRKDKVSRIRHQIDSGTYLIKGDKIAFRMIKESVLNQRIMA